MFVKLLEISNDHHRKSYLNHAVGWSEKSILWLFYNDLMLGVVFTMFSIWYFFLIRAACKGAYSLSFWLAFTSFIRLFCLRTYIRTKGKLCKFSSRSVSVQSVISHPSPRLWSFVWAFPSHVTMMLPCSMSCFFMNLRLIYC